MNRSDIDIRDSKYAELMYKYIVRNEDIAEDFVIKKSYLNCSIAEYIYSFRKEEFITYILNHTEEILP